MCFVPMKNPETIDANCIVELSYELRDQTDKGWLIEVMNEHWPLKFYFGGGQMMPAFEQNLFGLREGDTFDFIIQAADAYGPIHQDLIKEISIQDLPESELFPNKVYEVGDKLVFTHSDGVQQLGMVTEVLHHSLLVDFNHSLAGHNLHFRGRVLYIRKPSADEAVQKRYLEPNGIRSNSWLSDGPEG